MVTVLPNGGPFSGTPVPVPGRIEAEDFDTGGEGIAYHDTEPQNLGMAYRPDEGVDLEGADGGGFDVFWIVAGEWLEYTFEVDEPGMYDFISYVSTVPGFGNFTLSVDNVDVSGQVDVLSTGGWQFWTPLPVEHVSLEAGVHILRLDFDSDTDLTGWLFSLNYIDVMESDPSSAGEAPAAVALARNYPNPFNPETTIEYVVPSDGPVSLTVFDTRGRQVRVLVDERKPAGRHAVSWDGRDDDGHPLASGVYFHRFEAAGETRVGKMVILK